MFLLDTNVVSDGMQPRPNPQVARWLAKTDEDRLFISVVTLAEIRYGIHRMAEGRRRADLDQWLRVGLPVRFYGRTVPVDTIIADVAGILAAERSLGGRPIETADALIAATARVHNLIVVTRDVKDFTGSVAHILNPWTESGASN